MARSSRTVPEVDHKPGGGNCKSRKIEKQHAMIEKQHEKIEKQHNNLERPISAVDKKGS